MPYELTYLALALVFLSVWFVVWFLSEDRRKVLKYSVLGSPAGSVSQYWYLQDYWSPSTAVLPYPIIEDFVFTFAVVGISVGIFVYMARGMVLHRVDGPTRSVRFAGIVLYIVLMHVIAVNIFGLNSVLTSALAFLGLFAFFSVKQPQIISPCLKTGLSVLGIFVVAYIVMEMLHPGVLSIWCTGCNPTGIMLGPLNVEELMWDFTFGVFAGSVVASLWIDRRIVN